MHSSTETFFQFSESVKGKPNQRPLAEIGMNLSIEIAQSADTFH